MNIQGRDITIGLTHSETRQVAMDVFRANFLEMRDEAAELVLQRAEILLDSFLQEAAREGLTEILEGRNPDFQYAFYSAQKEYARSGDEDLGELLVQLLIDRTKVQKRDLNQIVLNESLAVAPKLTSDQLDALSLIFFHKYFQFGGVESLADLHTRLEEFYFPFVAGASRNHSAYQHLEYVGCGGMSVLEVQSHEPFTRLYAGLFTKGFPESSLNMSLTEEQKSCLLIPCRRDEAMLQIDAIYEESIDELCERLGIDSRSLPRLKQVQVQNIMRPEEVSDDLTTALPWMAQFFKLWDETPIKSMTLTSVGVIIAHANIKRQTGEDIDLTSWL